MVTQFSTKVSVNILINNEVPLTFFDLLKTFLREVVKTVELQLSPENF